MQNVNDAAASDLIRDEGLKLRPYRCTAGKLTVGYGHNLDDVGISKTVAIFILRDDIEGCVVDLNRNARWWRSLPENCQRALINMCFNLGWPRLSKFQNMFAALQSGDYARAADEALDSLWANQVGERAQRVAALIREG